MRHGKGEGDLDLFGAAPVRIRPGRQGAQGRWSRVLSRSRGTQSSDCLQRHRGRSVDAGNRATELTCRVWLRRGCRGGLPAVLRDGRCRRGSRLFGESVPVPTLRTAGARRASVGCRCGVSRETGATRPNLRVGSRMTGVAGTGGRPEIASSEVPASGPPPRQPTDGSARKIRQGLASASRTRGCFD